MASQYVQIRTKTGFPSAIEHLESLIEALKRGTIFISQGGESILLKPSEPVNIEVAAEIEPNEGSYREKIALKLNWEIRESWMREGEELSILPQRTTAPVPAGSAAVSLFEGSGDDGSDGHREGAGTEERSPRVSKKAIAGLHKGKASRRNAKRKRSGKKK